MGSFWGQRGLTFSLKLLAHFFHILQGLVGRGLEGLASRLGAADGILEFDVDLKLLRVQRVKLSATLNDSLEHGSDQIGGGFGRDSGERGLREA